MLTAFNNITLTMVLIVQFSKKSTSMGNELYTRDTINVLDLITKQLNFYYDLNCTQSSEFFYSFYDCLNTLFVLTLHESNCSTILQKVKAKKTCPRINLFTCSQVKFKNNCLKHQHTPDYTCAVI